MNVTILVGNGFDLNLNLKTQYMDFIKEYCESTEDDNSVIERFKKDIEKDCRTWANAELAFGRYTSNFKECEKGAEEFCDCHDDFCEKLAIYLQKQESLLNLKYEAKDIAKIFGECISFSNLISGLFETERNSIREDVAKYGGGIRYNFINFNYTNSLDSLIKETSKISHSLGERVLSNGRFNNDFDKLYHVHGSTEYNMVLGVNDESQIQAPEIFEDLGEEYKNDLIKQYTNEMNGENIDSKCEKTLKESHFIYIYGMSIGETDALWWERIVELLVNHEYVHVVIHAYNAPQNRLIRRKFHTFCRISRSEFLKYYKCGDPVSDTVLKRIHIDPTNIFEDLQIFSATEDEAISMSATV